MHVTSAPGGFVAPKLNFAYEHSTLLLPLLVFSRVVHVPTPCFSSYKLLQCSSRVQG